MDALMSNELAKNINWRGVNNKFSFAPTLMSQLIVGCQNAPETYRFVTQYREKENSEIDPESYRKICAAAEKQTTPAHGPTKWRRGISLTTPLALYFFPASVYFYSN
ncbi:hypothetical protein EG68_10605 [Paragonimus skrjabini miyazakii]|uniref:Uncharacterized protein n=1 Tax=Paragonimus skrjabini miyazakii TaxID=59628 RepID=A0A8S9YFB1_9TREM|nr:hypothetical protein EG68_10605 [Paragonimus skrjabini miyazakii]